MNELGKFPIDLIENLVYKKLGANRSEVLQGPGHGRDNAVLSLGNNQVLVSTADPLSVIPALGFEDSAYISVHLLASDLATCGFSPQFLMVNLNLPPQMTDDQFTLYWNRFSLECEKLGISIIGGHTGRYVGSDYTVVGGGVMMTVAPADQYLASTMAQAGDVVMMTKGVAVASTAILSRVFPQTVEAHFGSTFLGRSQRYLERFSVVKDALAAASAGLRGDGVTAMHDVTEGGLLGALYELSQASNVSLTVNLDDAIITPEAKGICELFQLSPYSALSEGTLLLTVKPQKVNAVQQALDAKDVPSAVIGEVTEPKQGSWVKSRDQRAPLRKPDADPYWAAYWKAAKEGWK